MNTQHRPAGRVQHLSKRPTAPHSISRLAFTALIAGATLLGATASAQAQVPSPCDGQIFVSGDNQNGIAQQAHYFQMELATVVGDRITVLTGRIGVDDYTGRGNFVELTPGQTFTVTQEIVDLRANVDGPNTFVQNTNVTVNYEQSPPVTYLPTSFRCDPAPASEPTPEPTSNPTPTAAAQTSVAVQASVTQTAIDTNIAGRFGAGAGFSANSNGITVSTRGLDKAASDLGEPELNAWASLEGRRYTGTTTGDSRNLAFGIDRLLSPNVLIGGYVSYNDQTATVGGATTTTTSPLFGLYAARKMNNGLFVSGLVGYGRPDYAINGTNFTATRKMAGLSVSGQFEAGALRLTPLASVSTSREELPAAGTFAANTLESTQASLSLRAEPAQRLANGMLPYATLAAEYRRQGSNATSFEAFTKPRLGLGVDWQLAVGKLRLDVDYGNITSTANDLGVALVYDFKF